MKWTLLCFLCVASFFHTHPLSVCAERSSDGAGEEVMPLSADTINSDNHNTGNGNIPDDCCFSFYLRRLNKNLIRGYLLTDDRCMRPGVILITTKSRRICADPGLTWVQNIMKSLDEINL